MTITDPTGVPISHIIGIRQVTLSWQLLKYQDRQSTEIQIQVWRDGAGRIRWLSGIPGTATTYTITDLVDYGRYFFQVNGCQEGQHLDLKDHSYLTHTNLKL